MQSFSTHGRANAAANADRRGMFAGRSRKGKSAARAPIGASGYGLEALESRCLMSGTGLSATYYNNSDFTGTTVSRTDAQVNFDWAANAPASGIGADTFSVRWKGSVEAASSETYTFYTASDDGVRLWVGERLLIDNWTNHSVTENRGSIDLQAGQRYDLRMEFRENTGKAVAKLSWATPTR